MVADCCIGAVAGRRIFCSSRMRCFACLCIIRSKYQHMFQWRDAPPAAAAEAAAKASPVPKKKEASRFDNADLRGASAAALLAKL